MKRKSYVMSALQDYLAPAGVGITINIGDGSNVNIAREIGSAIFDAGCRPTAEEDGEDRSRYYRECHEIAKRLSMYPQMRHYMRQQWGTDVIWQLSDQQLAALLEYMCGLERQTVG